MPTRKNTVGRVNARHKSATERAEARTALGDAGQLAKLEKAGFGHTREAAKLRKKLAS